MWSQTLTFVNIPIKLCSAWKPPPSQSCSRASVKHPPDFITWPVLNPVPCAATVPFLYNFHDPKVFSQDAQIWCQLPSFADIEVGLPKENNYVIKTRSQIGTLDARLFHGHIHHFMVLYTSLGKLQVTKVMLPLLWFSLTSLYDWIKKFAPASQPIRS